MFNKLSTYCCFSLHRNIFSCSASFNHMINERNHLQLCHSQVHKILIFFYRQALQYTFHITGLKIADVFTFVNSLTLCDSLCIRRITSSNNLFCFSSGPDFRSTIKDRTSCWKNAVQLGQIKILAVVGITWSMGVVVVGRNYLPWFSTPA